MPCVRCYVRRGDEADGNPGAKTGASPTEADDVGATKFLYVWNAAVVEVVSGWEIGPLDNVPHSPRNCAALIEMGFKPSTLYGAQSARVSACPLASLCSSLCVCTCNISRRPVHDEALLWPEQQAALHQAALTGLLQRHRHKQPLPPPQLPVVKVQPAPGAGVEQPGALPAVMQPHQTGPPHSPHPVLIQVPVCARDALTTVPAHVLCRSARQPS